MFFFGLNLGWGVHGHVHGHVLGPLISLDFHLVDTTKLHRHVLGQCILLNVIFGPISPDINITYQTLVVYKILIMDF